MIRRAGLLDVLLKRSGEVLLMMGQILTQSGGGRGQD